MRQVLIRAITPFLGTACVEFQRFRFSVVIRQTLGGDAAQVLSMRQSKRMERCGELSHDKARRHTANSSSYIPGLNLDNVHPREEKSGDFQVR